MASINVSEEDFMFAAAAAWAARRSGNECAAAGLDKLGRKINAALCRDHASAKMVRLMGGEGKSLSWRDVPSVFDGEEPESN